MPLYRSYNLLATDHFYTIDRAEHLRATTALGYTNEGIAAWVYPNQLAQGHALSGELTPLFRSYNGIATDHFYTIDQAEHNRAPSIGWGHERNEGHVFSAKSQPGLVPLYRMYNGIGDHFYTTDVDERNNAIATLGYADENIEGYVFPANFRQE